MITGGDGHNAEARDGVFEVGGQDRNDRPASL